MNSKQNEWFFFRESKDLWLLPLQCDYRIKNPDIQNIGIANPDEQVANPDEQE